MSGAIAKVQTGDRTIDQLQSNILGALNPLIQNPLVGGTILASQKLQSGSNTISHGLGKALTGYIVIRQRAAAQIFDLQDSNSIPDKTLMLSASSAVTVDIYVF